MTSPAGRPTLAPCPGCGAPPRSPGPDPTAERHLITAAELQGLGLADDAVAVLWCPAIDAVAWPDLVRARMGLAEVLAGGGDLAGARDALLPHLRTDLDPADSAAQRAQATLENALGVIARTLGHLDEAAAHYAAALERLTALEPDDQLASLLHNLAGLCHARSASAEGVGHGRAGLELRERLHGPDHVLVAADRANLAGLLYDVGLVDEAESRFRQAMATFAKALGDGHPEVAVCLSGLASISARRGDRAQAERLYRRAVGIKTAHRGGAHLDTLVTEYNLARLLHEDGRPNEARALAERVVTELSGVVAAEHRVLVRARALLSELDATTA
ncbi:tetratricopeptide repeat protein [Actinokineospora sp. 24-640]